MTVYPMVSRHEHLTNVWYFIKTGQVKVFRVKHRYRFIGYRHGYEHDKPYYSIGFGYFAIAVWGFKDRGKKLALQALIKLVKRLNVR